jgi:hypothetical protein
LGIHYDNKVQLTKDQEFWIELQLLKNSLGVLLLILGGTLASSLPFFLGNFSWLVVVPFWLSGSWLILKLSVTFDKPTKKDLEEEKWSSMLKVNGGE